MQKQIVSTHWLKENLTKEKLVILDASPKSTISGDTSAEQGLCIPHSRILSIKEQFTNKNSNFPNTIPSALQFEQECQALGINTDSEIVVYDNLGIYTSPRVWWLFKVMGHENIRVLNGGLIDWMEKGYETIKKSALSQDYPAGNFKSEFHKEAVFKFEAIMENSTTNNFQVVDARSKGRFDGIAPEPRKHLQSGKIPNSINIPYQDVLKDGKFRPHQELKKIFEEQATPNKELVFTCGSGMTACIVLLASEIAYKSNQYLYDGSWTEYAERNEKFVVS